MTLLSVNVNKIATLRNSRGQNIPNLEKVVQDLMSYGVRGITIHPRPDERHIKQKDVYSIKKIIHQHNKETSGPRVEFNIEGYPSDAFMNMIFEILPDQCTLVPDPPEALTSNAGWKLKANSDFLKNILAALKENHVRSSLFIDPLDFDKDEQESLKGLSADRIELYTERYAKSYATTSKIKVSEEYAKCALNAHHLGVEINAGHDLNQQNLQFFLQEVPYVKEVSIGHALICEALYQGLSRTIANYHKLLGY